MIKFLIQVAYFEELSFFFYIAHNFLAFRYAVSYIYSLLAEEVKYNTYLPLDDCGNIGLYRIRKVSKLLNITF